MQRERNRDYLNKASRDWFTNKIHADVNNRTFQNVEKWTERSLWAASTLYAGRNVISLVRQEVNFNRYIQASKNFWSQPVKNYGIGDFANNRAYAGIDVERIVKNFKKVTSVKNSRLNYNPF